MEGTVYRNRKDKMMTKLRLWARYSGVELYGTIKESREGIYGYMQNGSTRKGTKLYGVSENGVYVWGGKTTGWTKAKDPVIPSNRKKKVENNLPIEMFEDGDYVDTFGSIASCSNQTGIAYQTIYSNLRGYSANVYGKYTFQRAEK